MEVKPALLELEQLDLTADALRKRRATLPELAALEACRAALAALDREREVLAARRLELEREEQRHEAQAAELRDRARKVEADLYAGTVTAARELAALQQEMQGFQRRQAEFEEQEFAVMQQLEALDAEAETLAVRRTQREAEAARLDAAIATARAEIDAELAHTAAERERLEPTLPESYRTAYARAWSHPRRKGRVTAPFEAGFCRGCRGKLPVMEATRILREPPEVAIPCPLCARILLR